MNPRQKQLKIERHKERQFEKVNSRQAEMALELLTVVSAYVLHEKFAFGAKRIDKFLTELYKLANRFSAGEVSISILANIIDAETVIKYDTDTRTWRIGE